MKKALSILLMLLPCLVAAAALPTSKIVFDTEPTTGNVRYDKFDNYTYYSSESFYLSPNAASEFKGYLSWIQHGNKGKSWTLGLFYFADDWLFISDDRAIKLILTRDGLDQMIEIMPEGKRSGDVLSSGQIFESITYSIHPNQIKQIAEADSIEFKVYGDKGSKSASLNQNAIENIRLIYLEHLAGWKWAKEPEIYNLPVREGLSMTKTVTVNRYVLSPPVNKKS